MVLLAGYRINLLGKTSFTNSKSFTRTWAYDFPTFSGFQNIRSNPLPGNWALVCAVASSQGHLSLTNKGSCSLFTWASSILFSVACFLLSDFLQSSMYRCCLTSLLYFLAPSTPISSMIWGSSSNDDFFWFDLAFSGFQLAFQLE